MVMVSWIFKSILVFFFFTKTYFYIVYMLNFFLIFKKILDMNQDECEY